MWCFHRNGGQEQTDTEKTNINSCNLKITALWDCSIMGFCMVDWGIYSPSSLPNWRAHESVTLDENNLSQFQHQEHPSG